MAHCLVQVGEKQRHFPLWITFFCQSADRSINRIDLVQYITTHYKGPRMVLAAAGGLYDKCNVCGSLCWGRERLCGTFFYSLHSVWGCARLLKYLKFQEWVLLALSRDQNISNPLEWDIQRNILISGNHFLQFYIICRKDRRDVENMRQNLFGYLQVHNFFWQKQRGEGENKMQTIVGI